MIETLRDMRTALGGIPLPGMKVFTYAGRSVGSIKKAFKAACEKAGVEDFKFHDFRHTAINNWRLQGNDYFRIMAATGHKTMSVFKRYNTVSQDELKVLVGRAEPPECNHGHQYGHHGPVKAPKHIVSI